MSSRVDRTVQEVPGFGNTGSRSTSSRPAASISANAASWAAFSTAVWVLAYPRVDDHATRAPRSAASAAPDWMAVSNDSVGWGSDVGSVRVGPAMTSRQRAASRTDRTMGPGTDVIEKECGPGPDPVNPYVVFMPGSPQYEEGMRMEPPPSLPVQAGNIPAARAAADPPDEPPGVRLGAPGLRVTPCNGVFVKITATNSAAVANPTSSAPPQRSRHTTV